MKVAAWIRAFALGTPLATAAVACSEGEQASVYRADDDGGDDGSVLPDGGAAGEGDEGGADADAAAPKRTCTGEGWCHTRVPDDQIFRDVWGDGTGVAWMVSEQGKILRWDGRAWIESYAGAGPLYAVWGSGPTDLWVGGEAGLLHGTGASSSAITWAPVDVGVPVRSIWGTSANDVWAVGYAESSWDDFGGRVLHFTGSASEADASAAWAIDRVSSDAPARFSKVWGTGANDVWIGGDADWSSARALHRVPDGHGGFVFRAGTQPTEGSFRGGGSLSRSNVFLLGFGPPETYYTGISADDGATFEWTHHDGFKTYYALNAVWGTGPNDVWLAGIFGRLRHWDGATWRTASIALDDVIPVIRDFYAIWGSGPADVWVVGQGIALHKGSPQKGKL